MTSKKPASKQPSEAINPKVLPRIRQLIIELNDRAQSRKALLDQLWIAESQTEDLRIELMRLLNHP